MVSALNIKPPKTLFEVFVNLPKGTAAQLIENNIVINPAPLDLHQRIIVKIIGKLDRFIELKNLGECRIAPYDVFFDKKNVFQPDICFISKKNIQFIKATGCFGPPDLIIEVLSPSNSHFDLYGKKILMNDLE